jgi:uncharacterized integral membrane protein|tara:strand:- start:103 stop:285 length:183 start_codon:yes stop_codon:yes gene_type:complete
MSALLHTSMVVLIAAAAVMGLLVMAIVIVDSVKEMMYLKSENSRLRAQVYKLSQQIYDDV